MAETHKPPRAVHAAAAPLRPRVRRGALLGRAHDRARAAPLGARGDPAGARPLRRLDRHPLLLPRRRSAAPAACASTANRRSPATPTSTPRAQRAADGVIEIEPMGNMPVIKDLIVDMDAVHWKKIQRVTPWLLAKQPVPEREYLVAARGDGRRHPDDGLHPVRRVRLGLPGDGGRPRLHRPGGARQGLPLRRRPARRRAARAPAATSPRTRRASTTARTASSASRPARRTSTRWARSCACGGSRSPTSTSSTRTTASATRPRSRR